ncbi:Bug family tripartite tricarboxylate transporter substrate binding protein [Tardiphaga sp. 604_B6_N1_1]|uniref:Bug family tripartite tricarboxylate transporter substrate binding protein n=1 Tax=unclassified Tardiphaga TaxID=2631404 RepID=UPI003F22773F
MFRYFSVFLTGLMLAFPASAFPIVGKPVKIIVPFAAGGSTDIMARKIGERLSEKLGVPVIVENKPGGNTTIAATEVGRSTPDGHTLLYTSLVTFALNTHLLKPKTYGSLEDFTPICGLSTTNVVFLAAPHVKASNLAELVAAARAANGRMTYGSIGVGSVAHILGQHIAKTAGVELIHVPYRGSAPASSDFLGGQIDTLFDPLPLAIPKIEAKKAQAIGIAARSRNSLLPDVPTFGEQGDRRMDQEVWIGLFGPAHLPTAISQRIGSEIAAIQKEKSLQEFMLQNGEQSLVMQGAEFAEYVMRSKDSWGSLINELDIRLPD